MQNLYGRLLAFTRDGVFRYTYDDGRILMANQGFIDILELDCRPEDIVGKHLRDVLEYTEKEGVIRRALDETGEIHQFEYNFKTLGGENKWVLHDSFIVDDPELGGKMVEAIVKDITYRKHVERALRESEEKYRNLVESARDGICIVTDGMLAYANPRLAGMTGYRVDDIVGKPFADFVEPGELPKVMGAYEAVLAGRDDAEPMGTALRRQTGGRLDVEITASAMMHDGCRAVMVVIRDIAERKRWERALRETERLEAVRALASGVSHNFTNIINVIRGYASSILDSLLPNTKAHEYAQRIIDATNHAMHLTRRVVSVAEAHDTATPVQLGPVSLDRVLKDITDLIAHPFSGQNVVFRLRNAGAMPHVTADAHQLVDALMNVLLNASEAMPDGGTISIDTIERRILRPRSNPDAKGGVYVGLRVRDTGVGMSKETSRRAFEPFFTTKEGSMSFGLGLTIAQSTMQSMGGWIDLRGREGAGCVVRLFLPKADAPQPAPAAGPAPAGARAVLLLDDRLDELTMMKDALEKEGFAVHTAGDVRSGLSVYKRHADSIAVTVLDLMLPQEGGEHMLKEILRHNPEANVIVTSGFSRDYARGTLRMGAWEFLQKPFEQHKLVQSVGHILRQGAEVPRG